LEQPQHTEISSRKKKRFAANATAQSLRNFSPGYYSYHRQPTSRRAEAPSLNKSWLLGLFTLHGGKAKGTACNFAFGK